MLRKAASHLSLVDMVNHSVMSVFICATLRHFLEERLPCNLIVTSLLFPEN